MEKRMFDKTRRQIEMERDYLKLRMHLMKQDAKDEWEKLEGKWGEFEDSMRLMKYDAEKTSEKVTESLGEAAEELKKGYEKFRERLTKPLK